MRTSSSFYSKYLRGNAYRTLLVPIALVIVCLFIYFGKLENNIFGDLRKYSTNVVYNITSIISTPANIIKDGFASVYNLQNIYQENQKYKNMQLLDSASFQEMVSMKLKIAQYEELLNVSKDIEFNYATLRIIGDFSNNYNSSLLLNAGENDDVAVDMPVLGLNGTIGRISKVHKNISRVMLINNINSRIPVSISEKGFQGILIGQGPKNPTIEYIDNIEYISIGDLVTTSGRGGLFPPYQLVGQVINKYDNRIEVEIFEDISSLTHVKLLDYKLDNDN